ncbi:MAG: exo-alpha-sialidase [Actinobacteria bacterium]|nr:exo-alpha-sialidase [Actinomycetota bacterium]
MSIHRRLAAGAATLALVMTFSSAAFGAAQIDWDAPDTVSSSGAEGWQPRVTTSSNGQRITAVWRSKALGVADIATATSSNGGATWSPPQTRDGMSSSGEPALVSSEDGQQVTAVWYSESLDRVRTASSSNGGQDWSTPKDIDDPVEPVSLNSNPRLAGSANGTKLVAVWIASLNSGKFIAQSSVSTDAGATWSPPETISNSTEDAYDSDVAVSADGSKSLVAYSQSVGGAQRVFARTSDDGGQNWGPSTPISLGDGGSSPRVALAADGVRAHVAFEETVAGKSQVQARASTDAGSNWTTPAPLSDASEDADRVALLASADGTGVVAAWQHFDGANDRIQTSVSADSGGTWSAPQTQSPAGSAASYPTLAGSDDGQRVTLVWSREDALTKDLIETRSSADGAGTWTPTVRLSGEGGDAYDGALAASADGRRVVAMWSRQEGADFRIQASSAQLRTEPGAPSGVTAAAGDGQLTASWTLPVDDGLSPITSYTATAAPGGQTCTTAAISCSITGLTNGTSYTVTVTATNALGTGPASAASNAVTPTGPAPDPAVKRTTVVAKAVKGKSKLRVTVRPNLGTKKQWRFVVKVKKGKWKTVKTSKGRTKVYRTKGSKHTLTINLPGGRYKATSKAARGYKADTSKVVRLVR